MTTNGCVPCPRLRPLTLFGVAGLNSSVEEFVSAGTVVTSVISPASAGSVRGPSVSRKVTSVAAVTSSVHAAAMTTIDRQERHS